MSNIRLENERVNLEGLEKITRKAQQAVAVSKAICYGWLDLKGCEVEALLDLSVELSEDVGAYLLELSEQKTQETEK